MKKYYLHNGTESSGPFNIEELIAKQITSKTPVWFEGMEQWKTASEIEELQSIFKIPPPIGIFTEEEPIKRKLRPETPKILGLSKNIFFIILFGISIAIIGALVLNAINKSRSRELEQLNHQTEAENYQLELKQKEAEEQKMQDIIFDEINTKIKSSNEKQATTNRLMEIDRLISNYQEELDFTKEKLKDASGFKLFRSAMTKKEELFLLQKEIDAINAKIIPLKRESNVLKLMLEKIRN